MKPIRIIAVLVAASLLLAAVGSVSAASMPGAIWTTDASCSGVDLNVDYHSKQEVYLNGGPTGGGGGLPDGYYYVRVTDPSGATLLGYTPTASVLVVDGHIDHCYQLWAILIKGSDSTPGYDTTPNPGGEYEVAISQDPTFPGDLRKTDNFKVARLLVVGKDALTSFTRTWAWTIDKSVTPSSWSLFTGDAGTSQYTVTVAKTGYADSAWTATGTITIQNPDPYFSAKIASVTDIISGFGAVPVSCGVPFPYDLAPGATLTCTYAATLPDASARTNSVTVVTSSGSKVEGGSAMAAVDFGSATIVPVNASIHVTDSNGGAWTFADSGSAAYAKTFACDADEGSHSNTATITETAQSDGASVDVACYALTVTKDAAPSYTRSYNWTIDKTVTPAEWHLFTGDSGTSAYTVTVTKSGPIDSEWAVEGNISIHNPAPMAATIHSVADVVSPDLGTLVNCGVTFPHSLAAGGTLGCTYGTALANADTRTNTATATLQNYAYDKDLLATPSGTTPFSGQAQVVFGAPTTLKHDEIDVDDSNGGSWHFGASGSATYTKTFLCDADEGSHSNTATIRGTELSDGASVDVACYALAVSKDAHPSYTRTHSWTIDKSADQSALTLSIGQQFLVNYSVVVGSTYVDSAWAVTGTITIHNPAPITATLTSVADLVSPAIAADVACPALIVPQEGDLACTYAASLPSAAARQNTATATLQNHDYDQDLIPTAGGTTAFSGSADVTFGAPTTVIDECIDVTDTYAGSLGTVCAADAPVTFTYSRWIGPYAVCGEYTVGNTASFVANDSATAGSDSWSVAVHVPCLGCTLTPGYWKTHSKYGPAPYDDTWALLAPTGEDSPFFLSGQTTYQVLWTNPSGGNAYYILAHAYIAAQMNALNGADFTAAQAAYSAATVLLNAYTPAQVALLKGKTGGDVRAEFTTLAAILDNYNKGLIGPGHCSE
jgi:hypothetical protein